MKAIEAATVAVSAAGFGESLLRADEHPPIASMSMIMRDICNDFIVYAMLSTALNYNKEAIPTIACLHFSLGAGLVKHHFMEKHKKSVPNDCQAHSDDN